jgi:hypothetical protein
MGVVVILRNERWLARPLLFPPHKGEGSSRRRVFGFILAHKPLILPSFVGRESARRSLSGVGSPFRKAPQNKMHTCIDSVLLPCFT